MSLIETAIHAFEDAPLPDFVTRPAIGFLVEGARKRLIGAPSDVNFVFAEAMGQRPIAEHADMANAQHYEVPAAFFETVLGPRLKYSSCLYPTGRETLAEAEEIALAETCAHADLKDGQDILELGCGWGSLSLWMAEKYPAARITAVSNSHSQKEAIDGKARARGLSNLTIVTADMNDFTIDRTFDRIVSVEMFEHMANWRALLTRARGWLKPDGRLFIHVFSHKDAPYRFDVNDEADWIAKYFFAGGGDAEPRSDPRLSGPLHRGGGLALERSPLRKDGAGLAAQLRRLHRSHQPRPARDLRRARQGVGPTLAVVLPGHGGPVRASKR